MINYNRLGYEIKWDLTTFSEKISKGPAKPKSKFITQMLYGISAGNKVHLSEITRSLNEAIPDVRDGSTDEIKKGYYTIEEAVLSKGKKMPMPVYEKVFSAAEEGFISEMHESLCCLEPLSAHFSKTCVRSLDRGFRGIRLLKMWKLKHGFPLIFMAFHV